MRVLVTGGSGYIGTHLVNALLRRGDLIRSIDNRKPDYSKLPSNAQENLEFVKHNFLKEDFEEYWLDDIDAVVHLAGVALYSKWTKKQKRLIYESRVEVAKSIVSAMTGREQRPSVFVSASAVGIYGDAKNKELSENAGLGTGFFADMCKHWEREVAVANELGIRSVSIRTAVVLGGDDTMKKLQPLLRAKRKSTREKWLSWIHVDDLVAVYLRAIDDNLLDGPVNAASPDPVQRSEVSQMLAHITEPMVRPFSIPTHARYGEMARTLSHGQKVIPLKLAHIGYSYKYPYIKDALEEVFS